MIKVRLSHTQSLTNKDQREFEQLTTEKAKVNRNDYTRGRLFKKNGLCNKRLTEVLGEINAYNKNHPRILPQKQTFNLWSKK